MNIHTHIDNPTIITPHTYIRIHGYPCTFAYVRAHINTKEKERKKTVGNARVLVLWRDNSMTSTNSEEMLPAYPFCSSEEFAYLLPCWTPCECAGPTRISVLCEPQGRFRLNYLSSFHLAIRHSLANSRNLSKRSRQFDQTSCVRRTKEGISIQRFWRFLLLPYLWLSLSEES